MLSFRSFAGLGSLLRSVVHLHCVWCEIHVSPAAAQVPLVEDLAFPTQQLNVCIKNQVTIYLWVYFQTQFCSIDLFICLMSMPHYLNYFSFTVSLEIRYCKASELALLQHCFDYPDLLLVYKNLQGNL